MIYSTVSGAIVVRMDKEASEFENEKYRYLDGKDLYWLEFANEEKTEGFVSFVSNARVLDEYFPFELRYKLESQAVQFLIKDDCIAFFCSTISYVIRWKKFFETILETNFEILKHPYNEEVENNRNRIIQVMDKAMEMEEVCFFEIDKIMGTKFAYVVDGRTHIVKYYTNGLLHFGMLNDEIQVKKMINFVIAFDKQYKKRVR